MFHSPRTIPIAALALLNFAAGALAADWPTLGYDSRRCGCPDGSKLDPDSKILWRFRPELPAPIMSSPSVADGRLFVGCDDGKLYCLSTKTGEQLWNFTAKHIVFCSPVVADGRVYVGEGVHTDEDCRLYCLDAVTGKLLWSFQTEGHTEGTPLIAAGKIYFSGGPDGFYCLEAATGKKIWQHKGPHPDSSPILVGNTLMFGTGYEKPGVYAVAADTGKFLWHHGVKTACWGTPSVNAKGDRVFFGTGETRYGEKVESKPATVVCLDVRTGKAVWIYDTPSAVMSASLCVGDTVYVACAVGKVVALNADTGKERWVNELKQWVLASPCWAGNGLVIATQPGTVHILDPETGKSTKNWVLCRGTEDFTEGFVSGPALLAGRLYLGGLDGRVWCLGTP